MAERIRLNLTLTPARASQLRRLQRRIRAKSLCAVVYGLLKAVDVYLREAPEEDAEVCAEISRMFTALGRKEDLYEQES